MEEKQHLPRQGSCKYTEFGKRLAMQDRALPNYYLGMLWGIIARSLRFWMESLRRQKRVANWKAQRLSWGGKVTLINSVPDALFKYAMSLFPLPSKVEERLDKLRRDFLWLGNKEGTGIHSVKWQTTLLSKKEGGLGIKKLSVQNESLLSKWLWRFVHEELVLWRRVILY